MRVLRSPALHFLLIGVALFAITSEGGGREEKERIMIPRSRIESARLGFQETTGRPPTTAEYQAITATLVEQEVLFRYALTLGMHETPVVRRRLALIASFVAQNRSEPTTEEERADRAIELGLHHGDLVARRIMIDMARRTIRAPWLVRSPDDDTLQDYLDGNPELFQAPGTTRLTQVAVNRLKHGSGSEERARAIAELLHVGAHPIEEATELGDELQVRASLPHLTDQDLARKLGHRFVAAVTELPEGQWSDPIPSIHGLHVVYVHERHGPRVPPLAEVRDRVRRRFLQGLADQWLELRLAQLASTFEIVLPEQVS